MKSFPTKKATIYTLAYPTPNDIFYIGITTDCKARAESHKNRFKVPVIFEPLEVVDVFDLQYTTKSNVEAYWIQQFNSWGFRLKNKQLTSAYSSGIRKKASSKNLTGV